MIGTVYTKLSHTIVKLYPLRDQDILCGCNSVLLLTMTSIHKA